LLDEGGRSKDSGSLVVLSSNFLIPT
jgi:hypothetical protein